MSTRNRDEGRTSRGSPEADRASPDGPDTEVALEGTAQTRRNRATLILILLRSCCRSPPSFTVGPNRWNLQRPRNRHVRTDLWAWRTILVLISVTVLLSITAFIHGWPKPLEPPAPPEPPRAHGPVAPDPIGACELRQQAQRQWRAFRERLLRQQLRQTEGAIQGEIEAAFAPIYEGIPPFLDWHYSVIGQYVELGQAAFGRLQEEFAARLFAGLEGRIGHDPIQWTVSLS